MRRPCARLRSMAMGCEILPVRTWRSFARRMRSGGRRCLRSSPNSGATSTSKWAIPRPYSTPITPWSTWSVRWARRLGEARRDMSVHDTQISEPPRQRSWSGTLGHGLLRGLLALGLIALGALGAALVLRVERSTPPHPAGASSSQSVLETPAMSLPTAGPTTEPANDVEIMLSPEAVAQAGIQTA